MAGRRCTVMSLRTQAPNPLKLPHTHRAGERERGAEPVALPISITIAAHTKLAATRGVVERSLSVSLFRLRIRRVGSRS